MCVPIWVEDRLCEITPDNSKPFTVSACGGIELHKGVVGGGGSNDGVEGVACGYLDTGVEGVVMGCSDLIVGVRGAVLWEVV